MRKNRFELFWTFVLSCENLGDERKSAKSKFRSSLWCLTEKGNYKIAIENLVNKIFKSHHFSLHFQDRNSFIKWKRKCYYKNKKKNRWNYSRSDWNAIIGYYLFFEKLEREGGKMKGEEEKKEDKSGTDTRISKTSQRLESGENISISLFLNEKMSSLLGCEKFNRSKNHTGISFFFFLLPPLVFFF